MKKVIQSDAKKLRQKAEEEAKKRFSVEDIVPSVSETMKLIQELGVRQIELEMQGEELARAKEQLQASSEKYAELYDFALPGYFTLSKEGNIVELNLSGAKMLGKELSCLINSKFGFFVSDDTRSIFNSFLDKIFNTKAGEECDVKLSTSGSLPKYVHVMGIMAENGDHCMLSVFDMTSLKRSEEQVKTILNTTIDGFYLVDTEGRILDTNDSYCSMTGYSRGELLGMKIKDIEAADTEEVIKKRIQQILQTGYARFETRHLCKDGRIIDIEASVNFIADEQPKFFCFMRDITERKRAENALSESERLLKESQAIARLGSLVWDLSTGLWESSAILDEIFGIDENYIRSFEGWVNIVHPGWQVKMSDYVTNEVLGKNQPFDKEYQIVRQKDGCERWVHGLAKLERDNNNQPIKLIGTIRDITERRNTMSVLQLQSEIMSQINEAVYLVRMEDGVIVYTNSQFEEMFGYGPGEMLGKHVSIVNAPGKRSPEEEAKEIMGILEKNGRWDGEVINIKKDGTLFWSHAKVSVFDHSQFGRVLVDVHEDITERKRIDEALHESEKIFHNMFANNPQPMWIYDLETLAFLEINDAAIHHYGYSREEFLSMTLKDIRPKEDFEALMKDVEMTWQTYNLAGEWRHLKKNGAIINVEIISHSMVFYDHKARHVMVNDITERKLAEEKLQKNSLLIQNLVDNSPDLIYLLDLEGKFILANQKLETILGSSNSKLLGNTREIFLPKYLADQHRENDLKVINSKQILSFEEENLEADGKHFYLTQKFPLFDLNNQVYAVGGISTDITERKQAEKELILHRDHLEELVKLRTAELEFEKVKAQSADRFKSAFLATMSHELRTPLNSIIGFTGIISKGLSGPINDEQKKQLQMVTNSSRHLLALINDVLDISKIEAGQFEISNELFDLDASIAKVVGIVMPFVKNKSVALNIKTAHGLGEIEGDSRRIEQILFNLLSNAIKFTEKGKIELTTEFVSKYKFQRLSNKQAAIRFSVTDTGIGIRTEEIAKLFEPFHQIDSSLSREYTGTGLGLAICCRLANLMDGEIFVESIWGKGSTFTFMLPLKKKFPK